MKNLLFYLLALSVFSGTVHAQYSMPQPLVGGTSVSLYGMGEYENLGEKIYIGALFLPQLESSIRSGASKRMEMRIVADNLSARRFTQLWMDAITLGSSREERVVQAAQIQNFGGMFRESLIRGDQVSFEYLEFGSKTVVLINQVQIGAIPGIEFFNILLDAWVGDTPHSGQLKAGILGQVEADKSVLIKQKFAGLEYTEERHEHIAGIYGDSDYQRIRDKEDAQTVEPSGKVQDAQISDEAAAAKAARLEEAKKARLAAERIARLEAEKNARLEEERLARLDAEKNARLEEERLAQLEQEQIALLEEETRIALGKAEVARQEEKARQAAEQAEFESEQILLAAEYRTGLIKWLSTYVEYPQRALEKELEGKVELSVSINRSGEVLGKEIVSSSGSALLDQAALKMLERGSPLPTMPESLAGETYTFTMPLNFSL